jgi:hypothetical protein
VNLSFLDSLHWGLSALIEAIVFVLAIRRGLFDRLPIFTAYLFVLLVNEATTAAVYTLTGITSYASFVTAWTLQGVLVLLRALVIYEICRSLLSAHEGVWRLCRPILIGVAVVLGITAGTVAAKNVHFLEGFILTAGRGLEVIVLGILVFGLVFCRYYGLSIERHLAWIALGLGFYAAVQVANNTMLEHWLQYFPLWNDLRNFSFNIALVFWIVALWRPLPERRASAVVLGSGEYGELAAPVTARLRELNSRLLEMWK